jgi:putative endonuclease
MKAQRGSGKKGESIAVNYLRGLGYTILETNYRFDRAEVDVVAKDKDVLVFVEVKTRRAASIGEPEDAVTRQKRDLIRKAAEGYLYSTRLADAECRFDVIAIKQIGGRDEISHIIDAF